MTHSTSNMAPACLLDSDQSRFCSLASGNVRLLAPAGCGKTHSLLCRCCYLADVHTEIQPKFLIFTYTRAARDELRDRLKSQPEYQRISSLTAVTTLNAWGYRRIKSNLHNPRLMTKKKDLFFCLNNSLQPVWRKHPRITEILQDNRRKNQASREIMELIDTLKTLGFRHDKLKSNEDVNSHLDWLRKSGMFSHVQAMLRQLSDMELIREKDDPIKAFNFHFLRFWRQACTHLYDSALVTYEDQKYWPWLGVEEQLKKGKSITGSARYHHVLVDEFQDINPLDLALVRSIAIVNKASLTIVGDDDQAIYEWRGATPEFILNPNKHFGSKFKTCILSTNYRSPRNITDLSQQLIRHNKRRVAKEVRADTEVDALVEVVGVNDISEGAGFVLKTVNELLEQGDIRNVAIIGRKRGQIIPYQILFASQDIPFYAAEDLQLFLSEAFSELKKMLAIRAKADISSFLSGDPVNDLLMLCDKVKRYQLKKTDRETLTAHLRKERPKTLKNALGALLTYTGPLKGDNKGGRMSVTFAESIGEFLSAKTVSESIGALGEHFTGLQKDYGKSLEDVFFTDPPFVHLSEFARRYKDDYQSFYEDVERAVDTLVRIPPESDNDSEWNEWKLPLHLMTALRAKGKEFDAVIILDANGGIWPSKLAETEEELEQERRLFYVAMTRARKRLIFVVNERMLHEPVLPTPYLGEMNLSTDEN